MSDLGTSGADIVRESSKQIQQLIKYVYAIKDIQELHQEELVLEMQSRCAICSSPANGVWVNYPCATVQIINEHLVPGSNAGFKEAK